MGVYERRREIVGCRNGLSNKEWAPRWERGRTIGGKKETLMWRKVEKVCVPCEMSIEQVGLSDLLGLRPLQLVGGLGHAKAIAQPRAPLPCHRRHHHHPKLRAAVRGTRRMRDLHIGTVIHKCFLVVVIIIVEVEVRSRESVGR